MGYVKNVSSTIDSTKMFSDNIIVLGNTIPTMHVSFLYNCIGHGLKFG